VQVHTIITLVVHAVICCLGRIAPFSARSHLYDSRSNIMHTPSSPLYYHYYITSDDPSPFWTHIILLYYAVSYTHTRVHGMGIRANSESGLRWFRVHTPRSHGARFQLCTHVILEIIYSNDMCVCVCVCSAYNSNCEFEFLTGGWVLFFLHIIFWF